MTFDIEKMLREGATPAEINKAIAEATATARKKIDAEKAAEAEKRNREVQKIAKAKTAANALNDFLRFCEVCGPEEEVFTANDLLEAVSNSEITVKTIFDSTDIDRLLDVLFPATASRKSSIFDKYKN